MDQNIISGQEGKRITIIGFVVNILLTCFKISAGILGKSSAMFADGIHSLSDILTDIIVFIGIKFTEQPADECHNYGHEKFETMATALISIFLFLVGFEILKSGIANVMTIYNGGIIPQPRVIAVIAAGVSVVIKEILYQCTVHIGKKTNSSALLANSWHHRSDALSSAGTLVGIGGAILLGKKWVVLDPIASIIVSFFIFKVAVEILLPAFSELMDSALTKDEKKEIIKIIQNCCNIRSFHKLRTRKLGNKAIIDCHIEVDNTMSIKVAHDIASELEERIKSNFGENTIIYIHMEPFNK